MKRSDIRHWLHQDTEFFNELFPSIYQRAVNWPYSGNAALKEAEAVSDTVIRLVEP